MGGGWWVVWDVRTPHRTSTQCRSAVHPDLESVLARGTTNLPDLQTCSARHCPTARPPSTAARTVCPPRSCFPAVALVPSRPLAPTVTHRSLSHRPYHDPSLADVADQNLTMTPTVRNQQHKGDPVDPDDPHYAEQVAAMPARVPVPPYWNKVFLTFGML